MPAMLSVLRGAPKACAGIGILIVMVLIGVLHEPILVLLGLGNTSGSALVLARSRPHGWVAFLGPGRLELAAIVVGLWNSLRIGFEAGSLSTALGVTVAFYASYRGGVLDSILSTITDVFLVVPAFPLLAAFNAYDRSGITINVIAVILSVFGWAIVARPVRSHALSLRTRSFVDLARATKEGTTEIIFTELMPNMLPYIAMGFSQAVMVAILSVIGLDVFGLGPSQTTDLGTLVYGAVEGPAMVLGNWQVVYMPMATIVLLFFALGLIVLGLEERFNPRLRRVVDQ